MVGYPHLWYAETIQHLRAAEDALNKACGPLTQVRDEPLFKQIHAKRLEIWELIKKAMEKGARDMDGVGNPK